MNDLFKVEPAAARLAAERATEDEVVALTAALQRMADAGPDLNEMVAADLDFHRLLLTMTCNDFLLQIDRVIAIGLAERDRIVHTATPARRPGPESPRALDAKLARWSVGSHRRARLGQRCRRLDQ